jgi:hypothetical protein
MASTRRALNSIVGLLRPMRERQSHELRGEKIALASPILLGNRLGLLGRGDPSRHQ